MLPPKLYIFTCPFCTFSLDVYINKSCNEIPDEILSFKNCILVKPNGEKFFSGKGNQSEKMYNFEIKKGVVIIKTEENY